jgi:hypothetical protein
MPPGAEETVPRPVPVLVTVRLRSPAPPSVDATFEMALMVSFSSKLITAA